MKSLCLAGEQPGLQRVERSGEPAKRAARPPRRPPGDSKRAWVVLRSIIYLRLNHTTAEIPQALALLLNHSQAGAAVLFSAPMRCFLQAAGWALEQHSHPV